MDNQLKEPKYQNSIKVPKVAKPTNKKTAQCSLPPCIIPVMFRYNEYRFDKMVYVVDNNQAHHLNNLFLILGKMDQDWATSCIYAR